MNAGERELARGSLYPGPPDTARYYVARKQQRSNVLWKFQTIRTARDYAVVMFMLRALNSYCPSELRELKIARTLLD